MRNISGSPVEGDNFFGRESELSFLKETLDCQDVLLLGPRRIGKTSMARALMRALRGEGWRAIEINVADCRDEAAFLAKLELALRPELNSTLGLLWDEIKDRVGALAGRIKSIKLSVPVAGALDVNLKDGVDESWTQVGNEVLSLICRLQNRWLIYIDELPIFLYNLIHDDAAHGVARVRRFLDWFRNDVRSVSGPQAVRWLVSGSVGLDTLVQQHAMADTINSLDHVMLPPFSREQARSMLEALAGHYALALDAAGVEALLSAVQWWQPYYLQLAFSQLRRLSAADTAADLAALIGPAVEKMSEPGSDNDFHHWEGRLSKQLAPANARHAIALLARAAQTRAGERPEALLAALHERMPDATAEEARALFVELRDILQRDAYWAPEGEGSERRYKFLLEPLRRWWQRRNAL